MREKCLWNFIVSPNGVNGKVMGTSKEEGTRWGTGLSSFQIKL